MFSIKNSVRINGLITLAALLIALLQQGAGAQIYSINVHYNSEFRKIDPSRAAFKAVEAMGRQQNFIHAEADGAKAWGYDEKSVVMVHSVALKGGSQIYVVAFSEDAHEAERVCNAISTFVFDGTYFIGPRVRDNPGSNRVRNRLAVCWTSLDKACSQSTFHDFARDGLQRDKFEYTGHGNDVAIGTVPGLMVVVIGVRQPDRKTTHVMVLAASGNTYSAEQHRNYVAINIEQEVLID